MKRSTDMVLMTDDQFAKRIPRGRAAAICQDEVVWEGPCYPLPTFALGVRIIEGTGEPLPLLVSARADAVDLLPSTHD